MREAWRIRAKGTARYRVALSPYGGTYANECRGASLRHLSQPNRASRTLSVCLEHYCTQASCGVCSGSPWVGLVQNIEGSVFVVGTEPSPFAPRSGRELGRFEHIP